LRRKASILQIVPTRSERRSCSSLAIWFGYTYRKDRFPQLCKSKLLPRSAGPYKVLAKINDNAYKIDHPIAEYGMSNSFNVADLTPYEE
jgi:hypothetical protein